MIIETTQLETKRAETTELHAKQAQATSSQPKSMIAAVITAPGEVRIEEVPLPKPGYQEVLVALEGCGVCASNLPVWEGREWFNYPLPPGNPGHEGWGRIVAVGSGAAAFKVGDRVAFLSQNAYASHDLASINSLVKLPPALNGQPVPAEPLACAFNVFARSQIAPGSRVAVIGIGFLGALLTHLAKQAGAEVIAISRRPFALEMAQKFGAAHLIPMQDHWEIIDQVMTITKGKGCECVIEAVGQQWPLDLAGELTAVRGRLIVAGYHQDGPRQVNMQLWNWRGLDVINAHERDPAIYLSGMKSAIRALAHDQLDPTPLYTHTLPLDRLDQAFALLQERPHGFFKALVTP
ncbi:MAG: zinc-binding dehydrogenase [Caldilineaceae bacterium]